MGKCSPGKNAKIDGKRLQVTISIQRRELGAAFIYRYQHLFTKMLISLKIAAYCPCIPTARGLVGAIERKSRRYEKGTGLDNVGIGGGGHDSLHIHQAKRVHGHESRQSPLNRYIIRNQWPRRDPLLTRFFFRQLFRAPLFSASGNTQQYRCRCQS